MRSNLDKEIPLEYNLLSEEPRQTYYLFGQSSYLKYSDIKNNFPLVIVGSADYLNKIIIEMDKYNFNYNIETLNYKIRKFRNLYLNIYIIYFI